MIKGIDHLGLAVQDLGETQQLFDQILNRSAFKSETVDSEGVEVAFYQTGESKLEFLQSIAEDSAIEKYIAKKGEGIHHVAFEVDDIYEEINRLKNQGFPFINETPKAGADNKLVTFIHPKYTKGILIELCQEKSAS